MYRVIVSVLFAGWFAAAAVGAGLLVGLSQTDGLVRYPEAARVVRPRVRLDTLSTGYISQSGVYHTSDHLPEVLHWYVQRFDVSPDGVPAAMAMGNCISLGKADEAIFIRHMVGITLCSKTHGTMIFVYRSGFVHR